jgi:hypothetical protein
MDLSLPEGGGSNEARNQKRHCAFRRHLSPCVFACLAGLCLDVRAQDAMRLRGNIDSVVGELLRVSPSIGISIPVELKPQTVVQTLTKAQPTELKEGVQIGAQVRTQPDATLNAVLVIIFPSSVQSQQQGEANLMIGHIVAQEKGEKGPVFTVKYTEGQKRITLTSDAQLWRAAQGQISDLRKGASVSLSAIKQADGKLITDRISVSPDGMSAPPI